MKSALKPDEKLFNAPKPRLLTINRRPHEWNLISITCCNWNITLWHEAPLRGHAIGDP